MLQLIILEGPRGTGKSTVARELRSSIWGSTLINLTGFTEDGERGLNKIKDYYQALMLYLTSLAQSDEKYCVIFDRTFFSEMVYSPIYKSYDFKPFYSYLLNGLFSCADEINLIYMKVDDEEELRRRLNRDKVQLFDKVEESVAQSTKQQQYYDQLFDGIQAHFVGKKGSFQVIETSRLTVEDVKKTILEGIKCQTVEEKPSM